MTTDRMALRELLEKGLALDLLRAMIGYVAQRLMALDVEGLCGALGTASVGRHEKLGSSALSVQAGLRAADPHSLGRLTRRKARAGVANRIWRGRTSAA